jgi:hypothetical protein
VVGIVPHRLSFANVERNHAMSTIDGDNVFAQKTDLFVTEGQRDPLLGLACREASYFVDDDGEPYASVVVGTRSEDPPVEPPKEVVRLRSNHFRIWLDGLAYRNFGRVPRPARRQELVAVLEAVARFDAPRESVHVRLAQTQDEDAIFLDLANERRQVVQVTAHGWSIVSEAPIRFLRPKGMRSLPCPVHGGTVEELRSLLNVGDEAFPLLIAWLIGALRPRGPYPVLVLQGEQGSGKSTTARMVKALIDPTQAPLRSMPKSERDLAIAVANAWVPAYDNLSGISPNTSDALCRISTGGGISTRQLYTDTTEIILDLSRPLLINGIDHLATRPDLAERSLVLEVPPLDPSQRTDEAHLWRRFDEASPRILGALLDGVASALRQYESTRPSELPRMADFARWVSAAEDGLRWRRGAALKAYRDHRRLADREATECDPVAFLVPFVLELQHGMPWTGDASSLLCMLRSAAEDHHRAWGSLPKAPNALSSHLKRIAPLLRANGYDVSFGRTSRERTIVIAKGPSSSSLLTKTKASA